MFDHLQKNEKTTIEVWLSLVERYVRDVEAASSNLVTSTILALKHFSEPFSFAFCTAFFEG